MIQNCSIRCLPKGYKNTDSWMDMLIAAYSSTINNSQIMEIVQMSIDWWMDKEDVVYIYNGILFNHKKWNLAICNDMDGARVLC